MIDLVDSKKEKIADVCRQLAVRRLDLFGSAVGEDFDPNRSDVDFLVEFSDHTRPGILRRYLALADALESILLRPVDLLTVQSVRNSCFKASIERSKELVYAA